MKRYRINEIFYSLQGEGLFAGTAAVFVRFSGCNLKCPFCDTDFSNYVEMTAQEILDEVKKADYGDCGHIIVTGGEPTLQWDEELSKVLRKDYYVHMETNGTRELQGEVDYLTISPKGQWLGKAAELVIKEYDEIKVVVDEDTDLEQLSKLYEKMDTLAQLYIQPCDTGFIKRNAEIIKKCVEFVKMFPSWNLSLQQQKILKIR